MRNARKVRFPNIEVLMRKLNSILAAAILLLFMIHGILGTLTMVDAAMIITKHMARFMVVLIVIHTVLSCILTAKALKTWKVTGAPYFKENTLFWARRISGLAIMILIAFHMISFMSTTPGSFTLPYFGGSLLAANILLVISVAVHVTTNVKPMLISFGIRSLKPRVGDILFVLSVLLVLFIIGFIIYYFRWNTI